MIVSALRSNIGRRNLLVLEQNHDVRRQKEERGRRKKRGSPLPTERFGRKCRPFWSLSLSSTSHRRNDCLLHHSFASQKIRGPRFYFLRLLKYLLDCNAIRT